MSESEAMRAINDRLTAALRERQQATLNVQERQDQLKSAQEIEQALDDTVAAIKREADIQRAIEALRAAQWVLVTLIIFPAESWVFCRACFDQLPAFLIKHAEAITDTGNYTERDDACLGCGKIPATIPEGGTDHG